MEDSVIEKAWVFGMSREEESERRHVYIMAE